MVAVDGSPPQAGNDEDDGFDVHAAQGGRHDAGICDEGCVDSHVLDAPGTVIRTSLRGWAARSPETAARGIAQHILLFIRELMADEPEQEHDILELMRIAHAGHRPGRRCPPDPHHAAGRGAHPMRGGAHRTGAAVRIHRLRTCAKSRGRPW
ncbi:hypothetical protein ACFYRC_37030 [Streptomyces sp. NPDC005279]|uniref:hypothetical protein n=1 Tax=Streptomyces sp. NPDC005279 TaxID=3364712 RepID=UPI003681F3DA